MLHLLKQEKYYPNEYTTDFEKFKEELTSKKYIVA